MYFIYKKKKKEKKAHFSPPKKKFLEAVAIDCSKTVRKIKNQQHQANEKPEQSNEFQRFFKSFELSWKT